MKKEAKENLKKITVTFDLNGDEDKKILTELEDYIANYNKTLDLVCKTKSKKDLEVNEAMALKKYILKKGDLRLLDDVVSSLDEESFYHYVHLAHCKKTGMEISKYEFFRNELHKYKDSDLKKMVISSIHQ